MQKKQENLLKLRLFLEPFFLVKEQMLISIKTLERNLGLRSRSKMIYSIVKEHLKKQGKVFEEKKRDLSILLVLMPAKKFFMTLYQIVKRFLIGLVQQR
jgi:hypothetical protein